MEKSIQGRQVEETSTNMYNCRVEEMANPLDIIC